MSVPFGVLVSLLLMLAGIWAYNRFSGGNVATLGARTSGMGDGC